MAHLPAVTNESIIEDLRLVSVPSIWRSPWTWLLIVTAAVVGGILFRRWLASRPPPLKPFVPAPPGPAPHLEALRRLEELRARHAALSAYQVALECSDILRRFTEEQFSLHIRYQTTREFLGEAAVSSNLNGESRKELGVFLEFFDGIKFAQESATREQTGAVIEGAERFVRKCVSPQIETAA